MDIRRFLPVTFALMLLWLAGFSVASDAAKEENEIRSLDKAWVQAAQAKDLDKCVSFYADDASMLPPGAPISTGKAQIRDAWQHFMALPGYGIDFSPTKVVISKSGDSAYEIGTTKFTMNDDKGNPMTSIGKYVVNWEKRGGHWKVVADIFNNDK